MVNIHTFLIHPYLDRTEAYLHKHDHNLDKIKRERIISEIIKDLGYACKHCLLSFKIEIKQIDNTTFLFPIDNPEKKDKLTCSSGTLLADIEREKPDLVIFKGMGYLLNRWLILNSRHKFRFAFIVGGGTKDIWAPYADYILAETQQQIDDNFQEQQRQGRVAILPKLNLPQSFQLSTKKDFDVINVGGFTANKNQKALIPLARDFRMAMIGDGELFSSVKEMAKPYIDNVYMPGNLSKDQIPLLIARSRLMVHPAHHEGLPRVVMESFACGVPVIASKRAMPNAFKHDVYGLLVEPDEIIPAAKELLADDARLRQMGKNAYKYAMNNCTEEAVFKVIQHMFDKVFSEPPVFKRNKYDLFKLRIQSAGILGLSNIKRVARAVGLNKIKENYYQNSEIQK